MYRGFKTRGESIDEYAEAFRQDAGNREAAKILFDKIEFLISAEFVNRETKILCLSQEIDNIICGNLEAQKGGAGK